MLVELRTLKPNRMRDFIVDPIDDEVVEKLRQSIKDYKFWGGVVCRQLWDGTKKGDIEMVAGHHRIKAAIEAGEVHGDVTVLDSRQFDDAAALLIYATENATQRGTSGTAQVGSVASAVRYLAKAVLNGQTSVQLDGRCLDTVRGQIASKKGLGREVVAEFLSGVPGINLKTVQQALANLKASGNYARIIHEVQQEIERETDEQLRTLEENQEGEQPKEKAKKIKNVGKVKKIAAKAARSANGKPRTFDFEGVAQHLKNPHQIDVFRECVTGAGVKDYLTVDRQAQIAEELVAKAKERGAELSGAFIKERITALVLGEKDEEREYTRQEKEIERQSAEKRLKEYKHDFVRCIRTMYKLGNKIKEEAENWPKGLEFPDFGNEFRHHVRTAKEIIDALYSRI